MVLELVDFKKKNSNLIVEYSKITKKLFLK